MKEGFDTRRVESDAWVAEEHGAKKSVIGLWFLADASAPVSSGAAVTGGSCDSAESVPGTTISSGIADACCACDSAETGGGTTVSCDWLKTQKAVFPVWCSDALDHSQS